MTSLEETPDAVNNPYSAPSSDLDQAPERPVSLWLVLPMAAIATLPSIWLASLYTEAIRAALYLGHRPYFGHPDPKDLPDNFHPHTKPLGFLIPAAVFVTLTALTTFLLLRFPGWRGRLWLAVLVVPSFWALYSFLLCLDPAGVFEWICD
jgi:hypothetical protein